MTAVTLTDTAVGWAAAVVGRWRPFWNTPLAPTLQHHCVPQPASARTRRQQILADWPERLTSSQDGKPHEVARRALPPPCVPSWRGQPSAILRHVTHYARIPRGSLRSRLHVSSPQLRRRVRRTAWRQQAGGHILTQTRTDQYPARILLPGVGANVPPLQPARHREPSRRMGPSNSRRAAAAVGERRVQHRLAAPTLLDGNIRFFDGTDWIVDTRPTTFDGKQWVIDGRTASAASAGLGALDGAPSSAAYIDGRPDTADVGFNSAAPRVDAIQSPHGSMHAVLGSTVGGRTHPGQWVLTFSQAARVPGMLSPSRHSSPDSAHTNSCSTGCERKQQPPLGTAHL